MARAGEIGMNGYGNTDRERREISQCVTVEPISIAGKYDCKEVILQTYGCLTYIYIVSSHSMKATQKTDTIHFSVKGQVVIPSWLRKEFQIREGTRALVYQEGEVIVLKPITPRHIKNLRGSLKGSGVLKSLMEDRKGEREL
jgi:AbrB family looped-hinge helix DNA binding protein